jgi:hypothetical protein
MDYATAHLVRFVIAVVLTAAYVALGFLNPLWFVVVPVVLVGLGVLWIFTE